MLATWRRILPFVLTGLLLFNLAEAIATGGHANWLMVAIIALTLALTIWRRQHPEP